VELAPCAAGEAATGAKHKTYRIRSQNLQPKPDSIKPDIERQSHWLKASHIVSSRDHLHQHLNLSPKQPKFVTINQQKYWIHTAATIISGVQPAAADVRQPTITNY
jgi:hypothetical protein